MSFRKDSSRERSDSYKHPRLSAAGKWLHRWHLPQARWQNFQSCGRQTRARSGFSYHQINPDLLIVVPPTPEQEEVSRLVTEVFRAWQQAGIPFLVLRNYENLPRAISNDIDILLKPEQLRP